MEVELYHGVLFFFFTFSCICMQRETKQDGRTERISIDTDRQLDLELPSIENGTDKLQSKYF